jgi:hypothetical protein
MPGGVVGLSVRKRWRREARGACAVFVLLVAVLLGRTFVRGQDGGPAVPKTPVRITAEQIVTWTERGERVYFLLGNGRIDQGNNTVVTFPRGVIWISDQTKGLTKAYFLDVYGEEGMIMEQDGRRQEGPRGVAALMTRGAITIQCATGQPPTQDMSQDVIYQRALQERPRIGAFKATGDTAPPATVTPTTPSGVVPAGAVDVGPGIVPAGAVNLGGVIPAVGIAPPPENAIQQVQAAAPPADLPPVLPPIAPPIAPPITPTTPVDPKLATPPPPPFFGPAPAPGDKKPADAKPAPPRQFSIRPRGAEELTIKTYVAPNGETVYVVSQPSIIRITDPRDKGKTDKTKDKDKDGPNAGVLDIESDRMVFWTQGDGKKLFESMQTPEGEQAQHIELYLAGHVEMRSETKTESQTIRCDELYYDVQRNVAIAVKTDLEIKQAKSAQSIHVKTPQLFQLNSKVFTAANAEVYSTKLPSDPGLKVVVKNVVVEEREIERKTIWGRPIYDPVTGEQKVDKLHWFTGENLFLDVEGVPIFYFPYLSGDVEDPFGPLNNISVGEDNIFGFKARVSFDGFQLFGLDKWPGARWRIDVDYYSERGPALGTEFDYAGKDLLGLPSKYQVLVRAFGIYDVGNDILGGNRGTEEFVPPDKFIPYQHPEWRGRFLAQLNVQELPLGFTFQSKVALISDKNFMEQYFQNEWLNDLNQETYVYLKQQQANWAWSILAEPRLRDWITETQWLPRADGWILGEKLFDYFTWDTHATVAFAGLRPTDQPQFAYAKNDVRVDTGVFNLWNEVAMPFDAGPFRLVPYILAEGAFYTSDVNGDPLGRLYGGAGLRASIPFSRLYPDVCSELFNLNSLYHKITLSSNYLYAQSSEHYNRFPQLDRLNDDATDQALRDIHYQQIFFNPANAAALTTSPLFDPQVYAIRRLIDSRIDTLDDINVMQLELSQRLQTRRGLGASEHVVDWMSLNVGVSLFPQPNRDNFGSVAGIIEYDWLWNIGDRTALFSNGWFDPESGGPRTFAVGGVIGRPDGTNFLLSYRQIDPLQSRSVIASMNYALSEKYYLTASTVWDFGVDVQTYSLGITRVGTDLQMTLSLGYNSVVKSFAFQFEIVPNLIRSRFSPPPGAPGSFLTAAR